jgi:hypothetical protein
MVNTKDPRRPSERLPEWVPVLLEPDDRKMLEELSRLKGTDASRVIRALIIREHRNLRFMMEQ